MLHNKENEILGLFLGNYIREIYGRELINKVNMSQKEIALILNSLENKGILLSTKKGNIKFFKLNIKLMKLKDILAIAEFNRKMSFFDKHRKLAYVFTKDDSRIIGIFGSYAKSSETKESDVDIFIIGKKKPEDVLSAQRLGLKPNIKYFSESDMVKLLSEKNNLLNEIVLHHILVFGIEDFIRLIWRHHYGYD